ncbi:sulfur oxidation c-type cytochrome SoxX [Pseudoduganella aquatica]|uniref:Sulfur oxidation c-type cytochrome SoxX n=1 Tax=Pseudoduganella aquatica TaxID=2660641 RepID=A0A7X4KPM3_9BURK|nr:sulfur oxidation c-type cytochrome SoxX [Pseudoduganella aquatica]MYN10060.1 sulfur oxidation c-type cytochrome SoxX [Pseudoduganella aquatica]
MPGLLPNAALPAALAAAAVLFLADARAADYSSPLQGAAAGDAARGRAIVANRQVGLCLLCHTGPIPEERFQGNLAPPLDGAGDRSTAAQLRQRLVDARSMNPSTIMPSYYKTEGLARVSAAHQGKTILTAQQIEDVIAYLQTLRAERAP